ncbi:MAG: MATE family efflux transporter [Deltaproteobacteria bacterium]|nr:MATE family efflux transporter [Deltaproteobacteria bacterium]
MFARWREPQGYRDVLRISLPLVVSMASSTVMQFTDRVFLSNYSLEAIAAALPAGVACFLLIALFMGVAAYVNVFVAQYQGAGAYRRVGASLWQGIHFALMAWLVLASFYFLADGLFAWVAHPPRVRVLETVYFKICILGAGFVVLSTALSCFFSGRGLTRPVMVVHLSAAALNIPLDYALIFGAGPFPELGVAGAAIATVAAEALIVVLLAALIFNRRNEQEFGVLSGWRWHPEIFRRLVRFGFPGGGHFFLDVFAFTVFVLMVGRLGTVELAASNVVLALNMVAFLPMIGFSIGVSTLVGQAIGAGRPEEGARATASTLHITLCYMGLVGTAFVLAPHPLLALFGASSQNPAEFAEITAVGVVVLRFVALYTLFDGLAIIYSGALKGAGDIWFVLLAQGACSLGVMALPLYLTLEVWHGGLYAAWACLTGYVAVLGTVFWYRFHTGKWRRMRVIESAEKLARTGQEG